MAVEYSVEVCNSLKEKFAAAGLHRPMRVDRYDAGTELVYDVTAAGSANTAKVHLVVEKFVGGGYAGQVYRVRLTAIESEDGSIEALEVGGIYAIKILIPPSSFSRIFRNTLYWIGFQGPFQLQVNPEAAKAGVLWQKFIRRAAKIRFGDEKSVTDIYGTFVDHDLGSCGEMIEWVEGRTWRLEIDDHMDHLKQWQRKKTTDPEILGSPEYRAKKQFMADFVKLLHDMGAHEFARQYEWSTCKSQPNCLKRKDTEYDPEAGLIAVDFRAGLTLLPILPMSPGDFALIWKGLKRGSPVQFDRGSISKLERFIEEHRDEFADMKEMLEQLKSAEQVYRNSVPDITHNHIKLLYSGRLWNTMFASAVTGWKCRNLLDEKREQKLRSCKIATMMFFVIGLIPLLGRFVRRTWGRSDWRKHYGSMLTNWQYFQRAMKARIAEKVIIWHRAARVDGEHAIKISQSGLLFFCHMPFSILPAGLHRFLTDFERVKIKLYNFFGRPIMLCFYTHLREQWLRDMVTEGKKKHILTDEDAETILSKVKEPYVQRYLISIAVHIMTVPLTQIVSLIVAKIYHDRTGDVAGGIGILVLFQITPISPGSIARGLWAVGIAIYDRSFKDYNIAVPLSFLKYIGYLAFPIQMTYHYPALSRFMASHWATEAVHIVPVFGEQGALLEHWVFCLFYNWPLTIRRRMRKRAQMRATMKPRYWHVPLYAAIAAGVFAIIDHNYLSSNSRLPTIKDIWWFWALIPLLCGAWTALSAGGAAFSKRIAAAAVCGAIVGVLYTGVSMLLSYTAQIDSGAIVLTCVFRIFIFAIFSTIGAIIAELKLPDPDLK